MPKKCCYETIIKVAKTDPFGNIPTSAMRRYGIVIYNLNPVTARGSVGHTWLTAIVVYFIYRGIKKVGQGLDRYKANQDNAKKKIRIEAELKELRDRRQA